MGGRTCQVTYDSTGRTATLFRVSGLALRAPRRFGDAKQYLAAYYAAAQCGRAPIGYRGTPRVLHQTDGQPCSTIHMCRRIPVIQ
jgi:hypothetical protein